MEVEINSQSVIIENLINRYILNYCVLVDIPININRVVFVASGSSYNASLFGKYFFQNIANIEASCEYASEAAHSEYKDGCFDCTLDSTLALPPRQARYNTDSAHLCTKSRRCSA